MQGIRLAGLDPAKMRDATGLVIIDVINRDIKVQSAKQWFKTDYYTMEGKVKDICHNLQVQKLFVEVNNVGSHVFETLKRYDVPVYPIQTVTTIHDVKKLNSGKFLSKPDIVGYALKLVQEDRLKFPNAKSQDMLELKRQFAQFQETITPSGVPRYEAPPGAHDDLMMAMLLAIHGARQWLKTEFTLKMSLGPNPSGYVNKTHKSKRIY